MGAETTLLDPRKAEDGESTTTVAGPIGIRSLSLTVIAIVAAIFALQYGQQFFIPLVISVLVSYALDPIVSWIAKRGVARSLAAAVVLLLVVGSIGVSAYSLRDEAATIVQQLPEAAQRLRAALRKDRRANRGGHDRADAEGCLGAVPGRERGHGVDAAAEGRGARAGGGARCQGERLPLVELRRDPDVRRAGVVGAVSRVLHAHVGRPVQAEAGAGDRARR